MRYYIPQRRFCAGDMGNDALLLRKPSPQRFAMEKMLSVAKFVHFITNTSRQEFTVFLPNPTLTLRGDRYGTGISASS